MNFILKIVSLKGSKTRFLGIISKLIELLKIIFVSILFLVGLIIICSCVSNYPSFATKLGNLLTS